MPARRKEWAAGVKWTVEALGNAGIPVVFIRDVPFNKRYVDKCVARALWQGRDSSVCDASRAAAIE